MVNGRMDDFQLALMQQREYSGAASVLMGSMPFGAGAMITGISGALVHLDGTGLILVMLAIGPS